MRIGHLDYETRGRADLTQVGAYRYASDPETCILMAGIAGQDGEVLLWQNPQIAPAADPVENARALELLRSFDLIYVHNVGFELPMTVYRGLADMGWDGVPIESWRCTQAMARKAGLPDSLAKLSEALGLANAKDTRGKALIRLFSIPDELGQFRDPKDHREAWDEFCAYCRQDVRAEREVHAKLKPFELSGESLATFQFDLRLNQRGIPVNVPALRNAQKVISQVQDKVLDAFVRRSGFRPTQRAKVLERFQAMGYPKDNLQADTISEVLGTAITSELREELAMYQSISYAAAKKVTTMLECACADGHVRGTHLYYGAGTGRWSGRLIQPQNFKKTPEWMKKLTGQVFDALKAGRDMDQLSAVYGEPLELVAGVIRHFIPAQGPILDGDYSAVEARIICWLAGETEILNLWRQGRDLYRYMASHVYGRNEGDIPKDSMERQLGKQIELGCGFGMGRLKFRATCETYGIECSEDLAERCVEVYRSTHPKVVQYWYFLDDCARKAIAAPGTPFGAFVVRKIAGIPYLLGKLPSGRSLAYPYPKVELLPDDDRTQLTYWGQLPGTVAWGRVKLYGGKIAENFTQATAADCMSHGARTAEVRGFDVFQIIHDQALALWKDGQTAEAFADALAALPSWATGLPLKAETKIAPYYKK